MPSGQRISASRPAMASWRGRRAGPRRLFRDAVRICRGIRVAECDLVAEILGKPARFR
jgi:hypothetical protein